MAGHVVGDAVEDRALVLDCMLGSRKDSFARGVIAQLKERDRFLELVENYLGNEASKGQSEFDEQHDEDHGGREPGHDHGHHSLAEVHARIDALGLDPQTSTDAYRVYDILAAAEAKAHDVPLGDVRFHEVGNAEATIWIVISCLVMRQLMAEKGVTEIVATPICTGFGYVDCAHGRLSIPTPATANILENVPTFAGDTEGELTTPTGAALVIYFAQRFLDSVEEAETVLGLDDDLTVCIVGA